MVFAFLQRLLVSLVFVALGAVWAERLGVAVAIGLVALVAALASLVGAALLRGSAVGQVSWRNVVAGGLLPWGFVLGGGSLPRIAAHSAGCLAAMGAIGALAGRARLVSAAWVLDALALFTLLEMFAAQRGNGSARRQLLVPMAVVLGLAVAGGVLLHEGRPRAAAWVAAGPLVVAGVLYAAWVLMLITVGRKGRWN